MSRLRKQAEYDVLKALHDDMDGELQAISQYHDHIENISDPEIKAKLQEIVKEEEHHADELTELLDKFFGEATEVRNNLMDYLEDKRKQRETAE